MYPSQQQSFMYTDCSCFSHFRWKQKEPHDIVIECMKLSLDPIDRIQEKGTFMLSSTSKHSHQELMVDKSITSNLTGSCDSQGPEMVRLKERRMSDSATQTGKSLQSGDSGTDSCSLPVISSNEVVPGWSPSEVCQLNTPPSSQMSPSTSYPDLLLSFTVHSHCSTPVVMYTPGQSPTTSLGGDVADHLGYSSLPSVSGSRGKSSVMVGTHSGRGTPVKGGKAASHESQLARALFSALGQHSHESAPASIGGHQTSTPKEPEKCEADIDQVGSPVEEATYDRDTSPSGSLITFGEETNGNFPRSSSEQFNSSSFNILPKEEYRDLSGQGNLASGINEQQSLGVQHDGVNADNLPDSLTPVLTPVGGHSLDAVTLANSPGDSKSLAESTSPRTEHIESQDAISQSFDNSSLVHSGEHHDEPSSADFAKSQESEEVNKIETRLTSDDTSLELSKSHSTVPGAQQVYPSSNPCDPLAVFPQLLRLFKGEQEYNNSMTDSEEASFSRPPHHLLSNGTSPVEILDDYLKTGSIVHSSELLRY